MVGTGRIIARCDAFGVWQRPWLGDAEVDIDGYVLHPRRKDMGDMGVIELRAGCTIAIVDVTSTSMVEKAEKA